MAKKLTRSGKGGNKAQQSTLTASGAIKGKTTKSSSKASATAKNAAKASSSTISSSSSILSSPERARARLSSASANSAFEPSALNPASRASMDSSGSSLAGPDADIVLAPGYITDVIKKEAELLKRLKALSNVLSMLEQDLGTEPLKHLPALLVQANLLHHKKKELQLLVACCLADLLRIYAPEAPWETPVLLDMFKTFVSLLTSIDPNSSSTYPKSFYLLERLSIVKAFILLLDIEEGGLDLLITLFTGFFASSARASAKLENYMLDIMAAVLDELEAQVPNELLDTVLSQLLSSNRATASGKDTYQLAQRLITRTAGSLQTPVSNYIIEALSQSSWNEDDDDEAEQDRAGSLDSHATAHELVFELNKIDPTMLLYIVPHLQNELRVDDLAIRSETVNLLGRMFSARGSTLVSSYSRLYSDWLGRFGDLSPEVRAQMMTFVRPLFIHHPEAREELAAVLGPRFLDPTEAVRRDVVRAVCDTAQEDPWAVPVELLEAAADRMRDKRSALQKDAFRAFVDLFGSLAKRFNRAAWVLDAQGVAEKRASGSGAAPSRPSKPSGLFESDDEDSDEEGAEMKDVKVNQQVPTDSSAAVGTKAWTDEMEERFGWIPLRLLRQYHLNGADSAARVEGALTDVLLGLSSTTPLQTRAIVLADLWETAYEDQNQDDGLAIQALVTILSKKAAFRAAVTRYVRDAPKADSPRLHELLVNVGADLPSSLGGPDAAARFHSLGDKTIARAVATLIDPTASWSEAVSSRSTVLSRLGKKHPLLDFAGALTMRAAPLLVHQECFPVWIDLVKQAPAQPTWHLLKEAVKAEPVAASHYAADWVALLTDASKTKDNDAHGSIEALLSILGSLGALIGTKLPKALALRATNVFKDLAKPNKDLPVGQAVERVAGAAAALVKLFGADSVGTVYTYCMAVIDEARQQSAGDEPLDAINPATIAALGGLTKLTVLAPSPTDLSPDDVSDWLHDSVFPVCLMAKTRTKVSDWSATTQETQLKTAALSLLTALVMTPGASPEFVAGVRTLLVRLVARGGELVGAAWSSRAASEAAEAPAGVQLEDAALDGARLDGPTPEREREHLRKAAAVGLLTLAGVPALEKTLGPNLLMLLARLARDPCPEVRLGLAQATASGLKASKLPTKYSVLLVLVAALDPERDNAHYARSQLLTVFRMRRAVLAGRGSELNDRARAVILPEYVAPYLIWLLAHLPWTRVELDDAQNLTLALTSKALGLFLDVLGAAGDENWGFVKTLFGTIKRFDDASEADPSHRIHKVAELGDKLLAVKAEGKVWGQETLSQILLPSSMYRASATLTGKESYLDPNVQVSKSSRSAILGYSGNTLKSPKKRLSTASASSSTSATTAATSAKAKPSPRASKSPSAAPSRRSSRSSGRPSTYADMSDGSGAESDDENAVLNGSRLSAGIFGAGPQPVPVASRKRLSSGSSDVEKEASPAKRPRAVAPVKDENVEPTSSNTTSRSRRAARRRG